MFVLKKQLECNWFKMDHMSMIISQFKNLQQTHVKTVKTRLLLDTY